MERSTDGLVSPPPPPKPLQKKICLIPTEVIATFIKLIENAQDLDMCETTVEGWGDSAFNRNANACTDLEGDRGSGPPLKHQ